MSLPPDASSPGTEVLPLSFPVHIPFVQQLGFELVRMADGEAELRVHIREPHLNSWEVAHGGVLMTLLDVAMAHAARSLHRDQPGFGPGVVTVEMKTSFMRPGEGSLRAVGRLLHRTTTMAFCEGSVYGEDGRLCAHATGTFKYLRALPGKGRSLKSLQRRDG
ncbi:PaaI family thioesterase [Roseateles amylovorans]|uniref:PaaI family thioesterase n=1 Tax=Roseateles amylovorans TaxID=2978473 RepID=A0ABY6AZ77_9BURK|nr:PaaI family thioesterase [Roseateles amylovorans]UXH77196.1 PaaI family thioesterase [Roseateles amylovorans]